MARLGYANPPFDGPVPTADETITYYRGKTEGEARRIITDASWLAAIVALEVGFDRVASPPVR